MLAAAPLNGVGVTVVEADVSTSIGNEAIVAAAAESGHIDVVVCNAGTYSSAPLPELDDGEWRRTLENNLDSTFYLLRAALPHLVRGSRIVMITSVAAHRGSAGHSAYAAAKAAQVSLTRSLASELAPKGIRVNAVSPGVIITPMSVDLISESGASILPTIPLGRYGTPEDVAASVEFLASAGADFITGQVLHVNGGVFFG
jgi:3-oxoacyl-[acyl-carrier protein] reductase